MSLLHRLLVVGVATAAVAVAAVGGTSLGTAHPAAAVVQPAPSTAPAPVVRKVPKPVPVRRVAGVAERTVARKAGSTVVAVHRPAAVRRVVAAPPVLRHVETAVERGSRVLASLHYDWQRLGYRIQFLPPHEGLLGMTWPSKHLIQLYVRPTMTDLVLAHSIAHELGHALDFSTGTAARRASYLLIRGLDARQSWYGCNMCSDFQSPAGDWAEVFAAYLAGPGDFRGQLAAAPSATQLARLGALFSAP